MSSFTARCIWVLMTLTNPEQQGHSGCPVHRTLTDKAAGPVTNPAGDVKRNNCAPDLVTAPQASLPTIDRPC